MDNSRIPKQILYGELFEGTRNIGRPKLGLKDQCKTAMMEFSINVANWDMVAQDRIGWRSAVLVGAKNYQENRVQRVIESRQRRRFPTVDVSTVSYYCRHCQKPCRSRIFFFFFFFSAMSGSVFQDNSFSAAECRHRRKRPYILVSAMLLSLNQLDF